MKTPCNVFSYRRISLPCRHLLSTLFVVLFLFFGFHMWYLRQVLNNYVVRLGRRSEYVTSDEESANISGPTLRKMGTIRTVRAGGILEDLKQLEEYDFRHRLLAEKKFVPRPAQTDMERTARFHKIKRIVVLDGRHADPVGNINDEFAKRHCLVSLCFFDGNESKASLETADAVLFRHDFKLPYFRRPKNQIWGIFLLESPYVSPDLKPFGDGINFTGTFRTSSTIYNPYGVYLEYKRTGRPKPNNLKSINYAAGKTRKVAWMVSNCHIVRNARKQYATELQKYIQVDIYGRCGTMTCPVNNMFKCLKMLKRNYKFYLSFENANCREYITEKLFRNALANDLLPIVMGGHPDDYKKVAPPHSYIHVDEFDSPKALAEYLHRLDKNDTLYNEYFKWKQFGYVDATESFDFYCRFCALMWAERNRTWVSNVNSWWRRPGICQGPGKWRKENITDDSEVYQKYAPFP